RMCTVLGVAHKQDTFLARTVGRYPAHQTPSGFRTICRGPILPFGGEHFTIILVPSFRKPHPNTTAIAIGFQDNTFFQGSIKGRCVIEHIAIWAAQIPQAHSEVFVQCDPGLIPGYKIDVFLGSIKFDKIRPRVRFLKFLKEYGSQSLSQIPKIHPFPIYLRMGPCTPDPIMMEMIWRIYTC